MKIIQSPDRLKFNYTTLFLAGGISGCPNWQQDVIDMLDSQYESYGLNVVNPRRVGDLAKDGSEAIEQINWEINAIAYSDMFLFWFPKETLCPITLFELGKISMMLKAYEISNPLYESAENITIGIHPEYQRRVDIETQIPAILGRNFKFAYSLEELVKHTAKKLDLRKV